MANRCKVNCAYHDSQCGGKRKCEDCNSFKDEKCTKGRVYPKHINPHKLFSACAEFEENK